MISPEDVKKLREEFPKEAVQIYRRLRNPETGEEDKILTGIKNQYIVERLNDVFGHDAWDFEVVKYEVAQPFSWVLGRLTVYTIQKNTFEMIERTKITSKEQFGTAKFSKAMGIGDCLKAAATNALDKCASNLDIAHHAYKGLVPPPEDFESDKEAEVTTTEDLTELRSKLSKTCKEYGVKTKADLNVFIKNVLKEEIEAKELNAEQINKLVVHLEKNKAPF